MNERITLQDTAQSAIIKMSDGNSGAMTAMMEALSDDGKTDPDSVLGGMAVVLSLDTIGIYGSDIHILWAYICQRNTSKMISVLRAHQLGYISSGILRDACSRQDRSGVDMIDVEDLYRRVCEYLPNFDKENRIK